MRAFPRLLLAAVLTLTACADKAAPPPAPVTRKGPVFRANLLGEHRVRAPGDATFLWGLADAGFVIARDGDRPIPPQIEEVIADQHGRNVTRIEGRWELRSDGGLYLSRIRSYLREGGPAVEARDIALAPFRTSAVRFEVYGTQYVLGPR